VLARQGKFDVDQWSLCGKLKSTAVDWRKRSENIGTLKLCLLDLTNKILLTGTKALQRNSKELSIKIRSAARQPSL
jgi:hypothetical protein